MSNANNYLRQCREISDVKTHQWDKGILLLAEFQLTFMNTINQYIPIRIPLIGCSISFHVQLRYSIQRRISKVAFVHSILFIHQVCRYHTALQFEKGF